MALIAVDFDHTLVNGDQPIEGAKDAINLLREQGHQIVIHSCNDPAWIEKVLNNADIRYDYLWDRQGKPICDCYVDDKGYRFEGEWNNDTVADILWHINGLDNRKAALINAEQESV